MVDYKRAKEIATRLELDEEQVNKYSEGIEKSFVQSPLIFVDDALEH